MTSMTPMTRSTSGLILALLVAVAFAACGKGGDNANAAPTPVQAGELGKVNAVDGKAPAGSLATAGSAAPDFTLKDLDGKDVSLASFRGKTVVLEWYNPDCPFVRAQHSEGPMRTMAKEVAAKGVVWLSINSSAAGKEGNGVDRNKASVTEYGIENPILLDESGAVGKLYQARTTPHMVVIAPDGTLAYLGAIDNAPLGRVPESGYVNHVSEALADLAAGRPVKVPQTKGYGCSVKYAN
ncbi:MAG: thioredoxin family protein [Myxococcota bacterium]